MSEYETVKKQYETFKLRLKELNALEDQIHHAWVMSEGDDDRNEYQAWLEADENARAMHKCVRVLAYELVVLEHKELGTSLTKLFKEYGIAVAVIRKLLAKNGVAYMRPTLVQWLPIGTAPRDGTVVLGFANNEDGTVFLSEIMWCKKNETIIGVADNEVGPEQWFSLLLSGSVCPTHWMPLPMRPQIEDVK